MRRGVATAKRPGARCFPAAWLRGRPLARYFALVVPALVAAGVCVGVFLGDA